MQSFDELRDISLSDLEAIRLLLRGGSVIDWHRLNFKTPEEIERFLRSQEIDLDDGVFLPVSFLSQNGGAHPIVASAGYFAAVERILLALRPGGIEKLAHIDTNGKDAQKRAMSARRWLVRWT